MNKGFRLLFGLLILLNVVVGGLGFVRLFSWSSLSSIDKFFYCFVSVLFIFSLYLAFLFSRMDNLPSLSNVEIPVRRDDVELNELRKELDKVSVVSSDSGLIRSPAPLRSVPPIVAKLTEDVSMYQEENRNIIKPVIQQEDNKDDTEYSGVF